MGASSVLSSLRSHVDILSGPADLWISSLRPSKRCFTPWGSIEIDVMSGVDDSLKGGRGEPVLTVKSEAKYLFKISAFSKWSM